MIAVTPSRKLKPTLFWILSLMWCSAPTALGQEPCNTTACVEVAEVIDQTVNLSLNPCSDFFTYVCSGWLQTVKEKKSNKIQEELGTYTSLDKNVVPRILSKFIRRVRDGKENASLDGFRRSELQPINFFLSCLRARENNNWDLTLQTLRNFFHEVDLAFFDEPIPPGGTAFSAIMKLTLQLLHRHREGWLQAGEIILDRSGQYTSSVRQSPLQELESQPSLSQPNS